MKLTWQTNYQFQIQSSEASGYNPFAFDLSDIPGFTDYSSTYSQYRILKARMFVTRVTSSSSSAGINETSNLLVVPSSPFASMVTPAPLGEAGMTANYLPKLTEEQLRQSRWQKQYYPNTSKVAVNIGFHPFTFTAAFAPNSQSAAQTDLSLINIYQRMWRGRNWTPMQWAVLEGRPTAYFGPYIVLQNLQGNLASTNVSVPVTLTLYVQFRGQR